MRTGLVAFALFLCAGLAPAEGQGMTKLNSIRLYVTDAKLRERAGDVGPLAEYIQSLRREADAFWAAADRPDADGLLVAVGVRPGGKSRAWCEPVGGDVPPATLDKLAAALAKVEPVRVKGGPIAFAMELGLGGRMPAEFPVMPRAWTEAAKRSKEPPTVPDGLFKVIWPE